MSAPTKQIRIQLGSVELTDTDRRAIAWDYEGAFDDSKPKRWVFDVSRTAGKLADREKCKRYLRKHGEHGVALVVRDYLNAGGLTASMETNKTGAQ